MQLFLSYPQTFPTTTISTMHSLLLHRKSTLMHIASPRRAHSQAPSLSSYTSQHFPTIHPQFPNIILVHCTQVTNETEKRVSHSFSSYLASPRTSHLHLFPDHHSWSTWRGAIYLQDEQGPGGQFQENHLMLLLEQEGGKERMARKERGRLRSSCLLSFELRGEAGGMTSDLVGYL